MRDDHISDNVRDDHISDNVRDDHISDDNVRDDHISDDTSAMATSVMIMCRMTASVMARQPEGRRRRPAQPRPLPPLGPKPRRARRSESAGWLLRIGPG